MPKNNTGEVSNIIELLMAGKKIDNIKVDDETYYIIGNLNICVDYTGNRIVIEMISEDGDLLQRQLHPLNHSDSVGMLNMSIKCAIPFRDRSTAIWEII